MINATEPGKGTSSFLLLVMLLLLSLVKIQVPFFGLGEKVVNEPDPFSYLDFFGGYYDKG